MIEELATTAKQTATDLITLSNTHANEMQTWADILAEDPDIKVATYSAGFISDPSKAHTLELVIDVQAPPDSKSALRTWAIQTLTDDDRKESFNNIQLTFEADGQLVQELLTKGKTITREDIRQLLQNSTTRLARITVSDESGGDGIKETHGERYDFKMDELSRDLSKATKVNNTLQAVFQKLKLAGADQG